MTEVVNDLLMVEVENQADEKTVLSTSVFPWSSGPLCISSPSCVMLVTLLCGVVFV